MGAGCSVGGARVVVDDAPSEPVPLERRVLLELKVIGTKNLPKMDIVGNCDAYLRIRLPSGPVQTKVAKDTGANAKWNERFKAVIDEATEAITCELWDKDVGPKRDDFVGSFQLRLAELPAVRREFTVTLGPGVKPAPSGACVVVMSAGFFRDFQNLKAKLVERPGVVADDAKESIAVPLGSMPGMLQVCYSSDSEGGEGYKRVSVRLLETCPQQQAPQAISLQSSSKSSSSISAHKRSWLLVSKQRLGVRLTVVRKLPRTDKPPKTAGRFFHSVVAITKIAQLHHYTPLSRMFAVLGEEEPVFDATLQALIAENGGGPEMPFSDVISKLKPGCAAVGEPPGSTEKGDVFLPLPRGALLRVPWKDAPEAASFTILNPDDATDQGIAFFACCAGARKFTFDWHGKSRRMGGLLDVSVTSKSEPLPEDPSPLGIVLIDPNSRRSATIKLTDALPLQ